MIHRILTRPEHYVIHLLTPPLPSAQKTSKSIHYPTKPHLLTSNLNTYGEALLTACELKAIPFVDETAANLIASLVALECKKEHEVESDVDKPDTSIANDGLV
ncbi:MAG: hypothetical protein ACI8WB_004335 [Phenylobacterium sp.]|jgi:hypothetical protein